MEITPPVTLPAELLLAKLIEKLQIFSFQWTFQIIGNYGPCLRLPAQHLATGGLVLWVEDDEITLVIEHITHTHFNYSLPVFNLPPDSIPTTVDEQAKVVAQEAIDYILDVLLGRILFETVWHGH